MAFNLLVNNLQYSLDVEKETPLLWVECGADGEISYGSRA